MGQAAPAQPSLGQATVGGASLGHAIAQHGNEDHAALTASSAGTGPSPAVTGTGPNVIIPPADGLAGLAGLAQGGGLPIYESLESDWFRARGRTAAVRDGARAGVPAWVSARVPAAGAPADSPRNWTSAGDDGWRIAAATTTPATGGTTAAGLPKRVPQANLVPGSASDQQARTATMAEAAEIARSRLANFQRGSRRARATARQLTPGD